MLEICQNNAPEWILMSCMLQMTRRSATIIVMYYTTRCTTSAVIIIVMIIGLFTTISNIIYFKIRFQSNVKRESYEQLSHVNSEML